MKHIEMCEHCPNVALVDCEYHGPKAPLPSESLHDPKVVRRLLAQPLLGVDQCDCGVNLHTCPTHQGSTPIRNASGRIVGYKVPQPIDVRVELKVKGNAEAIIAKLTDEFEREMFDEIRRTSALRGYVVDEPPEGIRSLIRAAAHQLARTHALFMPMVEMLGRQAGAFAEEKLRRLMNEIGLRR